MNKTAGLLLLLVAIADNPPKSLSRLPVKDFSFAVSSFNYRFALHRRPKSPEQSEFDHHRWRLRYQAGGRLFDECKPYHPELSSKN